MYPMATQPSFTASLTLAVTALIGWSIFASESELFSLSIRGTCPANRSADASRNPSGAAYALHPESIASCTW